MTSTSRATLGTCLAHCSDQVKTRRPANGRNTLLVSWPTREPEPAASRTTAVRTRGTLNNSDDTS
jgi:hypothetical protein